MRRRLKMRVLNNGLVIIAVVLAGILLVELFTKFIVNRVLHDLTFMLGRVFGLR